MKAACFVLAAFSLGISHLVCADIGNITDFTRYNDNEASQSCLQYYSSCFEINPSVSGVQKIKVGNEIFDVYCDTTVAGKGWTVIQRRVSEEVNFFRKISSYEKGFGDLNGNFWIGLDKLNKITSLEPQELYIHLEDFNGETSFARYSLFRVGDVYSQYSLKSLGTYRGTAGDGMTFHLNQPFSTFDRDNSDGCAKARKGAWWYKNCQRSNLNGLYLGGSFDIQDMKGSGVVWYDWKGETYSLKTVSMMVRPRAISED